MHMKLKIGLPDGIKIKDISCNLGFTVFLSDCGRVFGMGSNCISALGLPRRIKRTKIPTKITFPNQSDSDKNRIIIATIYASQLGWIAVNSKQRAWIVGKYSTQFARSDFESLDPCIGIVEVREECIGLGHSTRLFHYLTSL